MYSFITGIVEEKANNLLVINCNGVGYEMLVSNYSLNNIEAVGEVATVYTYMHVREDAISLFGFSTKHEKELFLKLITVSGIGAKTAISILSGVNPSNLVNAIVLGDLAVLGSIKGIGKKTAERIVVELKSSLGDLSNLSAIQNTTPLVETVFSTEAIDALVHMGLTKFEAMKIVLAVAKENDTTEMIIEKALRNRN